MPDVNLGLEILLGGLHPALWDEHIKRETFRFLRKCGQDIPKKDLTRLTNAILEGPPRQRYREDLTDDEWIELRDHAIRQRLHKLVESDAPLPKKAQRAYDRIQRNLPWQPRGDRSEEFSFFMTSGFVDREESGPIEDFANMSVEEFVQWSNSQTGVPWECGGGWNLFFENEGRAALKLLRDAAMHGVWPIQPWYTALSRFEKAGNVPKTVEQEIANTLAEMPLEVLTKLAMQAAQWLESTRPKLTKTRRQYLWRQIWNASLLGEIPKDNLDFNMTLNHAGGILGSVLYDEMAEYIPQVPPAGENPGLPRQLRADFETIAEGDGPSAKLARVRMTSMLHILFRIDPNWTARALFNRMNLDDTITFDPYLWEGYLWSPRFTDDLLVAFKELFFKVLANLDCIPERIRNHGPQLFIHMAIPPNRHIDTDEAKGVLYKMEHDELADAAWALKEMLQAAGDKSPALWRETIGPWFDEAWPRRPRDKSQSISEKLAWMAIDAGDAFPDVVSAIKHILTPEEWQSALFHLTKKEEEARIVSRFSGAALTLADKLVGDRPNIMGDTLKTLLDAISRAEPKLKRSAAYKRLALKAE